MICPKCGSSNVSKVSSGRYCCNRCDTYFQVSVDMSQKEEVSAAKPKKKKQDFKITPKTLLRCFYGFIVFYILLYVILNSSFYREWKNRGWRERVEQYEREQDAKEKMEDLMLVPYYSYKSEFEAQKERVLPINILNIEMNMPIKNLVNYKGPEVEEIGLNESNDRLNNYYVNTKEDAEFFGARPHHFDGKWEDGKLLSVNLYYKISEDSIVTENVKKWAGKGFYTTYDKYRNPEQTWEYKNVEVKLYRPYNGNDVFLELTIPELDYDKLEKEKGKTSSASAHTGTSSSKSKAVYHSSRTSYDDGYWDGYHDGKNDGIEENAYWLNAYFHESGKEYKRGYKDGYKDGYNEYYGDWDADKEEDPF